MCSFIRAKKNDKLKNYFNLNEPHYLLTAYGAITGGVYNDNNIHAVSYHSTKTIESI